MGNVVSCCAKEEEAKPSGASGVAYQKLSQDPYATAPAPTQSYAGNQHHQQQQQQQANPIVASHTLTPVSQPNSYGATASASSPVTGGSSSSSSIRTPAPAAAAQSKAEVTPVPAPARAAEKNATPASSSSSAAAAAAAEEEDASMNMMHSTVGEHYGEDAFDKVRCACVFEILLIEQKFTSKLLYEKKFVWVNLSARSIHMSEHNSKERRHKEASLSDVTAVELGVPKKFKDGLAPIAEHCLTVVFKRGGGIDLKFDNQNTRDIWAETLTKIVGQINGGSSSSNSNGSGGL